MTLRPWLIALTEPAAVVIDLMALLIVVVGTLLAFAGALKLFAGHLRGQAVDGHARRALWLTYGRWLVAALTFQLAADIIESSIAPGWEAIGQLAAIAVIRTFLNYFLERDIGEVRARERVPAAVAAPSRPSSSELPHG